MHPIIFQTKYFTLHSFWIFVVIAIMAGTYALIKLSIKNNLKLQFLSDNSFKLILLTILGARIISLIKNYDTYFYELSLNANIKIFYIWDKGLDSWGAIVAFLLALYIICKRKGQSVLKWLDALIPAIILMIAITSIGAFFDGISYGKETLLPWGVNFENPSIKYTVPIHPTQIYAFVYSTIITITLILLTKTHKLKTGMIGLGGIIAYTFMRFLEEFLRGDDTLLIFGIRLPQIVFLLISIGTGIFFFLRYNKRNKSSKIKKTRLTQ